MEMISSWWSQDTWQTQVQTLSQVWQSFPDDQGYRLLSKVQQSFTHWVRSCWCKSDSAIEDCNQILLKLPSIAQSSKSNLWSSISCQRFSETQGEENCASSHNSEHRPELATNFSLCHREVGSSYWTLPWCPNSWVFRWARGQENPWDEHFFCWT